MEIQEFEVRKSKIGNPSLRRLERGAKSVIEFHAQKCERVEPYPVAALARGLE